MANSYLLKNKKCINILECIKDFISKVCGPRAIGCEVIMVANLKKNNKWIYVTNKN